MLTVLPIRYVRDVGASRSFYERLGLHFDAHASLGIWAELRSDGGVVGLHDAAASKGRKPGMVELGFVTNERLEDVAARLGRGGICCTICDEDFGRSIRVTDPDGVELQIQEIDSDKAQQSAREPNDASDGTAARVALWRALHALHDPPPHVLDDTIGLRLLDPRDDWARRPDMNLEATRRIRASIVARARFVEDLLAEQAACGVGQYVILGAGLDTFVQRRPEAAALRVFEVDRPGPQAWKRRRLVELGFGVPDRLRLVPVDFESGESWWDRLAAAGFDAGKPAVVASAGVSMYLSEEAIVSTLRRAASLAPGSMLMMTFLRPCHCFEKEEHAACTATERAARLGGTPFRSYCEPTEILALAREAGFSEVRHVSSLSLGERYFPKGGALRPSSWEELLVAAA